MASLPNAAFQSIRAPAGRVGQQTPTWNASAIQSSPVFTDSVQDGDLFLYDASTKQWVTGTAPTNGFKAATGSFAAPSYTFESSTGTGMLLAGANDLGFATNGVRQMVLDDDYHDIWVGPTATASSIRFTTAADITYIQNSDDFDKSSGAPTVGSFQTVRIAPYMSAVGLFDVTSSGVQASTGVPTYAAYGFVGDEDTGMFRPGDNEVGFTTGGTSRLEIDGATISASLPIVHPYATAAGTDAGVTIPDGTGVFQLTAGTETGAYALTGPSGVAGQVLYVRNSSGEATTGLVTASGAGAVFIYDGVAWLSV